MSYVNASAGVTVSLAVTLAQDTIGAGTDTLTGLENLTGSASDDGLTGSGTANLLDGLDGNDTLEGGGGNDTISGGTGTDIFVFAPDFGNDVIIDFEAGGAAGDVISIAASIFADFAAVLAATADDTNGDAVITVDADNTITLVNVHKDDLADNDFVFT